jgi:myo-inositol 2-dehydrogenase / D-chiro-inositol 1-dehydrogenase
MAPEPVRYGIIGTGMMGCEHILDIAAIPDAEVVAVCDPVEQSLQWAHGAARRELPAYRDHRELLARDDLDAVVVATPNHTHRHVLDDVLATDLAVLVEKPLCTTVADCLHVRRVAAERSAITWVGLEYRYIPTVAALLAELASGVCGTTRMVSIREHRFPFLTKVGNWNRFNENTGGTLVEKCCHFFDLMRLVAGAEPVRVMASGGQDVNHLEERYDGRRPDILDNAYVVVEFANGVRGCLDLSMFAEGGRFEQELTVVGDAAKLEATVPGDGVWVGVRGAAGPVHVAAAVPNGVPHPDLHGGSSYIEHLRFIDCVRAGAAPEVDVDDGLWSVATGVAAHLAIAERRVVELDELDGIAEVRRG